MNPNEQLASESLAKLLGSMPQENLVDLIIAQNNLIIQQQKILRSLGIKNPQSWNKNSQNVRNKYLSYIKDCNDTQELYRKTMEWVCHKFGPIRAAIFAYTAPKNDLGLAAYLNMELRTDRKVIKTLGEGFVKTIADQGVAEDNSLKLPKWGEQNAFGVSCSSINARGEPDEMVGVIVLLRDKKQPFSTSQKNALLAIREPFATRICEKSAICSPKEDDIALR